MLSRQRAAQKLRLVFFLLQTIRRADDVDTRALVYWKVKRFGGLRWYSGRKAATVKKGLNIAGGADSIVVLKELSVMSKCCGCIGVCAITEAYQPLKTHTHPRDIVQETFRNGREVLRSPRDRRRKPSVRYDVVRTPGSGR